MKKIFTLVAAASMVMVANAGTRVLYSQDFESVVSPADAGWSYGGEAMLISGDEFGKYLELKQGANNGRNAQGTWGTDIYGENGAALEDGKYTISFDYCPKQSPNNQYNSGITVLTNLTPPANQPFTGRWNYLKDAEGNNIEDMSLYQGYLLDLFQIQRETEDVSSIQYRVNGNDNDLITLNNEWYTITLDVDVNARTVDYAITTLDGLTTMAAGTRTVPATECDGTEISMYASSLWVMVARYQTIFQFDNFVIQCESSQDVANTPTVALTALGADEDGNLNLNLRTYTISFREGELLHIIEPSGNEVTVQFFDCDGTYKYNTTTSGLIKVYTTCGTATSEIVEVEVDCAPVVLPAAVAQIMSVSNGYGKEYKLTVDNSETPLAPTIFITYSFVGDEGEIVEGAEQTSGVTIKVTQKGILTLTTKAFGYQETTTTIDNDALYSEKFVVDFARMTSDQIKAAGFAATDDLNTGNQSGENCWTGRKRLFYYDAATATQDPETGETVYTPVYPFGFIAEDDAEHVLHRYIITPEELTEEKAANTFEHIVLWNGLQAKMLEHVGLIQDATTKNYNSVQVVGCGADDIVVCNTIASYGSDSNHPIVNNDAEYFAQLAGTNYAFPIKTTTTIVDEGGKSGTTYVVAQEDGSYTLYFRLYRIDTALTKVTVFGAGDAGVQSVGVDNVITDDAWYTITGLKLDRPMGAGLYIHNGKKVLVK